MNKKEQELICNYCKTKFTTKHPNYRPISCKCGEIMCDVTPFYIRVLLIGSRPENTTFLINRKVVEDE